MSEDYLDINQNIELEINQGPYQGRYMSKISDISEAEMTVMAIYDEELIPLRKNLPVDVYFNGEHAVYKFKSKVKKRYKDPIPLIVLSIPQEIKRIQRRQYFRLKVNKNIYYKLAKNDEDKQKKEDYKKTQIVDISGGGVKMVLNNDLKKGDIIQILLKIDCLKQTPITGKVVRFITSEDGYTKFAGIKFIDIKRSIQDKIIGWIFDYQRDLRRRGLL